MSSSGAGLEGAEVTAEVPDLGFEAMSISAPAGLFVIENVPDRASVALAVMKSGYATYQKTLQVDTSGTLSLLITLTAE